LFEYRRSKTKIAVYKAITAAKARKRVPTSQFPGSTILVSIDTVKSPGNLILVVNIEDAYQREEAKREGRIPLAPKNAAKNADKVNTVAKIGIRMVKI